MSNLIPLEDAARMLGLPVDKLSEMRSNSEVFGYKDGASWKFKMQELERVADEFGFTINPGAVGDAVSGAVGSVAGAASDAIKIDEDDFDLALDNDNEDSQLSFDISDSAEIILDDDESSAEISLVADNDDAFSLKDGGDLKGVGDDDFTIEDDAASIDLDSPLASKDSAELSFGTSDIQLAEGSSDNLLDDEEEGRGDPSTGKLLGDDDDDLVMSEDGLFEDDLKIEESHEDSLDLSSDFESSGDVIIESDSSAGSGLLEVSEDSDFSLSDSGLIDLADDSADDMIVLDEPAALDDATQLGDDDFNLTPVEEAMEVEDGSQIIALDDAEMYDDASATLLSPGDEMEAAPMLTDDAMGVDDFGAFDAGPIGMTPGVVPGSGALPESPYTTWQIASLGLVTSLLGIGGMIAYDLARNLWLPEDQIITGGLLPSILSLFG